jgi:hypothetical protein
MIKDILIIVGNAFSCGLLYSTTKEVITGKYKKFTINNFLNTGFIIGILIGYMYTVIEEPIIPYLIKKYI